MKETFILKAHSGKNTMYYHKAEYQGHNWYSKKDGINKNRELVEFNSPLEALKELNKWNSETVVRLQGILLKPTPYKLGPNNEIMFIYDDEVKISCYSIIPRSKVKM